LLLPLFTPLDRGNARESETGKSKVKNQKAKVKSKKRKTGCRLQAVGEGGRGERAKGRKGEVGSWDRE
jgi:hypothetical protein